MRILVTGSRDWDDREAIDRVLWEYEGYNDITLIHGAARGADAIAATHAHYRGWLIEAHPAKWQELGKAAGFIRNQHMVNLGADVCLAFIKDGSKGASHTAARAEAAGIPVRRFLA